MKYIFLFIFFIIELYKYNKYNVKYQNLFINICYNKDLIYGMEKL